MSRRGEIKEEIHTHRNNMNFQIQSLILWKPSSVKTPRLSGVRQTRSKKCHLHLNNLNDSKTQTITFKWNRRKRTQDTLTQLTQLKCLLLEQRLGYLKCWLKHPHSVSRRCENLPFIWNPLHPTIFDIISKLFLSSSTVNEIQIL